MKLKPKCLNNNIIVMGRANYLLNRIRFRGYKLKKVLALKVRPQNQNLV